VLDETQPRSVFAPLGLIHPDHLAVSEACRTLMSEYALTWYLYMDLPYGLASRITVSKRLRAFRQRADLVAFDGYDAEPGLKQRVMSLYETQYEQTRQNFRRRFDATTRGAERYWRVENPL
jgi:LmbE family N-acetylglucosaminyl deacetylase